MKRKFRTITLFLGVLTGSSTTAMFANNKPFTYITGVISILAFMVSLVTDIILANAEE